MITHLEPDFLECKIKWALGSITTNKASGGDGISTELFQILKDDAVKVLLVVVNEISSPAVCGIFPDQGSNPGLLHWQADSYPLRHKGSSVTEF